MPATAIVRYQTKLDTCRANAERTATVEVAELWRSLADVYSFLLRREQRQSDDHAI